MLEFADGKVRLVAVRALEGGLLVGHCLRELPQHLRELESRVVAIYRKGRSISPEGDTVVEDGDEVFFLAAQQRHPPRHERDAQAGRSGEADRDRRRRQHRLPPREGAREDQPGEAHRARHRARARKVSELLENAIVLNGDAADEELLIEENIDSADVFAALTNSEEANILSAMLAKRLGAHKVMALINKPSYTELMESGSIDVAISPQTITIGSLLAHVRRGDVVRVHSLRRGAAEALEAIVHGDETQLPRGRQAVERDRASRRRPHRRRRARRAGRSWRTTTRVVQSDDHVILFLSDRRHLEAVEKLFLRTSR